IPELPECRGLVGGLEYSAELFDGATATRFARGFEILLAAALAEPDRHLSELPLLTSTARHQVIQEWNATASSYPPGDSLHELIEAQVDRTPDAVAVTFDGLSFTYLELDRA